MRSLKRLALSTNRIGFLFVIAGSLTLPLFGSGCESSIPQPEKPADSSTVSGTVTLNGKPVGGGEIGLYSLQFGMAGQAALDPEGKFKLSDPIAPGEYRVYFFAGNGQSLSSMPTKYMSETSSDYTVSVKEGDNALTVDIKS